MVGSFFGNGGRAITTPKLMVSNVSGVEYHAVFEAGGGDDETQVSISPCLGGGLMICQPKEEATRETPPGKMNGCGIYDPNCDNEVLISLTWTQVGVGLGVAEAPDGTSCILIGPFASGPISFHLGNMSE